MTSGPCSFSVGHIQSLSIQQLGQAITLLKALHELTLSSLFGKYLTVERLVHVDDFTFPHVGEFRLI